jgi:hypothetical protein
MRLLRVSKSKKKDKKYDAVFEINGKEKTVSFGAAGYEDFTIHKDNDRRLRYIARHRATEDWTDPTTPGALSRYILWEEPSLSTAITKFKKRFNV